MKKKIPPQYRLADRAIRLLNRRAIKRFGEAKSRLSLLHFDELNVIKEIKTLYSKLEADNLEVFLELARMVYKQSRKETILSRRAARAKRDEEERQEWEELTELWLLDFLDSYNKTVHVIYSNEVLRKRDYAIESINSSANKVEQLDKSLFKWSRFTGWFTDEVTDAAVLKAFEDCRVESVKWNTEIDGRECKTCYDRNEKIYPINAIPDKPHPGCRCWITPVKFK